MDAWARSVQPSTALSGGLVAVADQLASVCSGQLQLSRVCFQWVSAHVVPPGAANLMWNVEVRVWGVGSRTPGSHQSRVSHTSVIRPTYSNSIPFIIIIMSALFGYMTALIIIIIIIITSSLIVGRNSGITSHTSHGHEFGTKCMQPVRPGPHCGLMVRVSNLTLRAYNSRGRGKPYTLYGHIESCTIEHGGVRFPLLAT